MTLFLALLIWFLGGGLMTALFQHVLLTILPKNTRRETPCIPAGLIFSIIRMAIICLFCVTLLDISPRSPIFKAIIFADVLWSALHAWYALRRYGSFARRSGFRTGVNLGSLIFGILYAAYALL